MSTKKWLSFILLVCLGVVLVVGFGFSGGVCAAKKSYTIGLYMHHRVPPWLVIENAARMRAEEISKEYGVDLKVDVQAPHLVADIERQSKVFDDFIAKKVDIVLALPITTTSYEVLIKKLTAAGIPLGAMYTEQEAPAGGKIEWWLRNDNREGGYLAGKALAKEMGGKGNVVFFQGIYECTWNRWRAVGIYDALKEHPEMRVLVDDTARWERLRATQLMEDVISRFGDKIDGFIALNDEMAIGAGVALDEAGIDVPIVGWDGTQFSCEHILEGRMDYSVDMHWASFGVQLIDLAWQTLNGIKVTPVRNIVRTSLIDKVYAKKLLKQIVDTKNMKKPGPAPIVDKSTEAWDWESLKLENYRRNVLKLEPGTYSEMPLLPE